MRTRYLSLCLFLLSFSLSVEAQSPGGVNGAELWYMSVPTGRDLTGTYEWKDFSGDSVKSRIYEKIVTVGSDCAPMATKRLSERSVSDDQIGVSDDSSFNVTETVAGSFTAHLSMARDISADLLVFDTSGKMLYNAQMEGGLEKTATFTLPQTGVYIVKAITQEKEYTQKILSR